MRKKSSHAPSVKEITRMLSLRYRNCDHYNRRNFLEELLFFLCSTQTNEDLYRDTFTALYHTYPTFEALADAPEAEIVDAIANGG